MLGGRSVRSGVELVWHAESTNSRNGRAALCDCDETTISTAPVATATILSAPFVGISGGRTDSEEIRSR
jgi:hypothetical protein